MAAPATIVPFLGLGSEEALRAVGDALPDGVFTTDLEGRVTWWNAAAERITGWSRAEAIGRDCSLLAGDAVNGCACGRGPLRCGLAARGRSSKQCTSRAKDGRPLVIVKSAVPLAGPRGEIVGALESFTLVGEPERAPPAAPDDGDFLGMVGRSPAMRELYRLVALVARSDATVMIFGESGAGKERVAEAIHRASPRAAGPFVRVSCAALNENLLESELFGHVKGAFTGALRERRGRFEEAHGGTLLLDEIGDVSPVVQTKLLRVIERREVERVGDSRPIPVDVRLACATHRDLERLVEEGRFRADLFFRLHVFPLRVPPLREREGDLALLAARLLGRMSPARALAEDARAALEAHGWPGNVRELQNALAYAALQAEDGAVRAEHLPPSLRGRARAPAPADEKAALLDALARAGWNRERTARALGLSRVTLWKRMKRHGIADPR